MIEKDKCRQDEWDTNRILKDAKENLGREDFTPIELLEYMLGDKEGWYRGSFIVYKYTDNSKRSVIQRINMLWVYPLFLLCIPFQWVCTGSIGVTQNSKIGKVLDKLVGFN